MTLPFLSVSFIGVMTGMAAAIAGRAGTEQTLARSLLGAWCGFVFGVLAGALLAVAVGTGGFVAVFSHVGAIAGSIAFSLRRSSSVPGSASP